MKKRLQIISCVCFLVFVCIAIAYSFLQKSPFSAEELREIRDLQTLLTDPLDCSLTLVQMKNGDKLINLKECELSSRRFEVKTNRYLCSKLVSQITFDKKFPAILINPLQINAEEKRGSITVKGKLSHFEKELKFSLQLNADQSISGCTPFMNDALTSSKDKLESYPGAGALDL